ncbi:type II CRISPR-associated endonuclease Cas1 [Polluticaenibacter yanchengensis]|uniref:CRISPR-associated endonuclease Cas1 n=1 Tax=Polluticaenibacter yanchengensis TaxID=3014562 RepID=A0ABT4UKV3_9BACT|nr:type II CRISPR-associated endonuclease Cas1 [Chitinophagaceae bacterium LY-5]
MIKRTLYFGNTAYLSMQNKQLAIKRDETLPAYVPIEDLGIIILDHPQITITQPLMVALLENNTALITCNASHHPIGLTLTLDGNTLYSQRSKSQIDASIPLKKQLWQQTVKAKIYNQSAVLAYTSLKPTDYLVKLGDAVKSGDSDNMEARAAVYYWPRVFPGIPNFVRERVGEPPNSLLNYGYAILRATVARALVGSGLIPSVGIFHRNQYNAYCLADDVMEPYRPYVDLLVYQMLEEGINVDELTIALKTKLLSIPVLDVKIGGKKSPLMNAVQRTCNSLVRCFDGEERKLLYPEIE